MHAYLDDLRAEFRGPRALIVWAGLTALLAVGGPLGTLHSCDFELRVLFWALVVVAMITLSAIVMDVMGRWSGDVPRKRDLVIAAAVVALVLTVPIRALAAGATEVGLAIVTSRTSETLAFLFLTALALSSVRHVELTPKEAMVLPQAAEDVSDMPRVVARLEPQLQGGLLSLTGRDHYVDVRTTAGTGAILMRFSDAMAEVAPVEGAQIHRSHWVAWAAIDGVERDGNKYFVVTGDQRLPVSRSFREALAARGLL